jgi:D-sedoheptulose 7-phosphate isomerase
MASEDLIFQAFERHAQVLQATKNAILPTVIEGGELIKKALLDGKLLLTCGNGGSAADAQHFAAEWMCKYKQDRRPFRALALHTDTSAMTAIANDYSYEEVFARQITALGSEGDILVAFTTSGSSKNIVKAIAVAKQKGMKIIAMTGAKGAHLASEVDCAIVIPTEETARIQEMHELIYHAWCENFDANVII